jgi:hypothetical protein
MKVFTLALALLLCVSAPGLSHAKDTQKLTVTAVAHNAQENDYTTTTPVQSNTNCSATDYSVNCNTTTYGGGSQTHAIYRFTQIVTANQDGKTIQYTLSRTARWRWSSMDWLTNGDSFPAEIKGKHMLIQCRRGGNQGKKETLKYDILDIRPVS